VYQLLEARKRGVRGVLQEEERLQGSLLIEERSLLFSGKLGGEGNS